MQIVKEQYVIVCEGFEEKPSLVETFEEAVQEVKDVQSKGYIVSSVGWECPDEHPTQEPTDEQKKAMQDLVGKQYWTGSYAWE